MVTAAPVTVVPPTGGTVISSTAFGQMCTTNLTAVLQAPAFRGYCASTQSIPNSTYTALLLDTESYDTQNSHTPATATFVAQTGWAGYHYVEGQYATAGNATGARFAAIYVTPSGGSPALWPGSQAGFATVPNSGIASVGVDDIVYLNAGDAVAIYAYQSSGGALLTNAANSSCVMSVTWLRQ